MCVTLAIFILISDERRGRKPTLERHLGSQPLPIIPLIPLYKRSSAITRCLRYLSAFSYNNLLPGSRGNSQLSEDHRMYLSWMQRSEGLTAVGERTGQISSSPLVEHPSQCLIPRSLVYALLSAFPSTFLFGLVVSFLTHTCRD